MKQSLRRFLAVVLASGIVATGSVTLAFAADYDQEWEQFQDASASMDENTRAALAGSIVGSLSQDSSSDPIEMRQMTLQQQLALLDAEIRKQLRELTLLPEEIEHAEDSAQCLQRFIRKSQQETRYRLQVQHYCGLPHKQMLKYVSSTGKWPDKVTGLGVTLVYQHIVMDIPILKMSLPIYEARLQTLTLKRNMVYAQMMDMAKHKKMQDN